MKTTKRPTLSKIGVEAIALIEIVRTEPQLTLNLVRGAITQLLKIAHALQTSKISREARNILQKISTVLIHLKKIIMLLPKTYEPCLKTLPQIDSFLNSCPA